MPPLWRDKLLPASFRGVPFHVRTHEVRGLARRSATHEYVNSNEAPFVEDLGIQGVEYKLSGYIIGEDYYVERDALVDALGKAGPGLLVHPYLGSIQAMCVDCKMSETTRDGGMVTFDFTFRATIENEFPRAQRSTVVLLETSVETVVEATTEQFGRTFVVDNQDSTSWVSNFAQDDVVVLANQLEVSRVATASQIIQKTAEVADAIEAYRTGRATLVLDPFAYAPVVKAIIQGIAGLATGGLIIDVLERLYAFGSGLAPVSAGTPQSFRIADNQSALIRLVRAGAVAEAARLSQTVDLDSYPDAVDLRDRLTNMIDSEITHLGDVVVTGADGSIDALTALLGAVVANLTERGAQLSKVSEFTPGQTVPALAIAYQLYGEASRVEDLVKRNTLPHPGFVEGGVPIEILNE